MDLIGLYAAVLCKPLLSSVYKSILIRFFIFLATLSL
jgi:hypothetical protein